MLSNSVHHLFLAAAHGAAAAGSVCCVLPKARIGAVAPPWLGWPKLMIWVAIAVKIGILALDLYAVSSITLLATASATTAAFYMTMQLLPDGIVNLLDTLNSPLATHTLALTSTLVDVLATSLSLTFTSTLFQGIISLCSCISMACSIWLLFIPPEHSVEATSKNHLLSVRHPFTAYYQLTMSMICDNLLDSQPPDPKHLNDEQLQEEDEDYLSELKQFLYQRHNLSLPLGSLLWTLRKPARIIATLSTGVALAVSAQAILMYTALFLLSHKSSTAYAAYLHCTLGFAVLYCAIAVSEAKVREFTTKLALKLRTSILSMVSEKIFRLSQQAATHAGLPRFLGTDLQEFIACIRTVPVGLINIFETIMSALGLAFIIGGFAYVILFSILVYIGYLACATIDIVPFQNEVTKKQKTRLSETRSIMQNLLAIKTLGLQSYYLQNLLRFRKEEIHARRNHRECTHVLAISLSTSYCVLTVLVLCGLAYRRAGQATNAEDIFPALLMLMILGGSIGNIKLTFASWTKFRYLQQLMDLLREAEIPLRFESAVQFDRKTQLQIQNLTCPNASHRERLLIKDINIELFRGDFLFVHGRTGSGKTAFLETILGEQMASTGSIHVADVQFAYCGQDTWIPDTSIQFCITGGAEVDEARYRRVITACRLSVEMTSLAYSSFARTGPDGCNLSRKDKLKILLARAAYSNASVVLLDDSFAAFDAVESVELAKTLLNPTDGLLREGNATVILASHSFAVPALIDDVYSLDTQQFIEYPVEDHSTGLDEASEERQASMTVPFVRTELGRNESRPNISAVAASGSGNNAFQGEARRVSLQKNIGFIWKTMVDQKGWKRYICIILCFTLAEAPLVFGTVVWPQLCLPLHVSAVLQLLLSIAYCWTIITTYRSGDRLSFAFWEQSHDKVATKILTSKLTATRTWTSAQLINLLGADLEILGTSRYQLYRFTYFLAFLIFPLSFLFWATNYSITAVFGTVSCIAMVEQAWSGTSKRASECSDQAIQRLNAKFAEVTEGLPYIRSFGWERFMLRQLLDAAHDSEAALKITLSLGPWFDMTMALCWTVLATTLVGYTFGHLSQMSPNMLGLGLLTLFGVPELAQDILSTSMDIQELVAATDRIRRFMMAVDKDESSNTDIFVDPLIENKDWNSIPEIVFENAEVGAIAPLNGVICNPGQVQIHGCNGSGKTALLLALLGKGEYKGSIRIDGVEVRNLSSDVISRVVSILPQDPVALPGTFEKNLFLTQYTHPDLAVEPIDQFLTSILDKLDLLHLTELNEGFEQLVCDMHLSQGQIALLNLARCAVDVLGKKTRIVVIDDMFSKLDREYADMARAFISQAFKACIVVIAETTSDSQLVVKGLNPLDANIANASKHNARRQIAALDEEVRQWYRAGYEDATPEDETSPEQEETEAEAQEPSSLSEEMPELSIAPPLPEHLPASHSTPSADPPTSPLPPSPNDPWLEPRRPAPRPPVKGKAIATAPAPEPPQDVIKTTIVQYDPSIFDVDKATEDNDDVGSEPSDRNPDGSLTQRERALIDALHGIPSERTRQRLARDRRTQELRRQAYPGSYPGKDKEDDDRNQKQWPRPGSMGHKIQQILIWFMIFYVFSMAGLIFVFFLLRR